MIIGNWTIEKYNDGKWEICCKGRLILSNIVIAPKIPIPRNIIKEAKKMGIII